MLLKSTDWTNCKAYSLIAYSLKNSFLVSV